METRDRQSQRKPNGVVDRLPVEPLAKCSKSSSSADGLLAGGVSFSLHRHSPVMPPKLLTTIGYCSVLVLFYGDMAILFYGSDVMDSVPLTNH
ncbi:unnamed protein product [[Candida] boidinii]|nr:unnamed protein product [[Candida] boidinii]